LVERKTSIAYIAIPERSLFLYSRQPNSSHCFVCGLKNPFGLKLRFLNTAPGEVLAEYTVPEQYQGYPGIVHGGVVAAMLDEVAGRAHMGQDPPRFMYTARLEIRYRQNVPVGQPLRIVGKAVKSKRRAATSSCAIYGPQGELLAEAEALLVDVPEDVTGSVDLDALGWKVYPEDESVSEGL
jgi:acyl-coenzyme A thioesterase PaaI-like protein